MKINFYLKLKNMNLNRNKLCKIGIIIIISFAQADNSSFNSNIFFGYDSNPMKLSVDEINQLDIYPFLLGNAEEVFSPFVGFNVKLKHSIIKRRIKLSWNLKGSYYNLSKDKSNYNFSFNLNKSLGDYRHFIFNYFIMPDFYLREYEDKDLYMVFEEGLENSFFSSYFSIEKIRITLLMPIKRKISSIRMSFIHERQVFNKNFTEFDLKLVGPVIEFKSKYNKYTYSISYENLFADNYTYSDGSFSTMHMDRGYVQQRYKISIEKKYSDKRKFGFSANVYKRKNTSSLEDDHLHNGRKHIDMTVSYWHKLNKNKVTISFRKRQTYSPYQWVVDLKTFKRVTITYTKYFNSIRF